MTDAVTEMIRERIREHGFTKLAIFSAEGDPDPQRPEYTHTIGLSPELIVVAMPELIADSVIEQILAEPSVTLEPGVLLRGLLLKGFELELRSVSNENALSWMPRAAEWHRDQGHPTFTALQVVWPDKNRRFPWDEGYSNGGQVLLA